MTLMRVLITGGAGFIGSNLAEQFVAEGWDVSVVDDLSNGHREFIPTGVRRFIHADFSDQKVLNNIHDKQYDVVAHLAAVPRVGYSVEHPVETNDANVSKTLKLIDACRNNVKRFVFASSSSVYGGADVLPTHESQPKRPKSPYALQKSIIEDYLQLYSDLYNLDSICLRFFNVFGPNQLGDSPYATAVSSWLFAIKSGKPMRSDGTGEQSRDMCYVSNVADACVKAATVDGKFYGRCFNIACGDRVTNNQILDYLMKRFPGATKADAPARVGDVLHTQGDVSRAFEELGYVPKVTFMEGLERTIRWVESTPEFLTLTLKT